MTPDLKNEKRAFMLLATRMPDLRRKNCQRCLKPSSAVGPISWRGNCRKCGHDAANAMFDDLTNHEGPGFDHWRLQLARSVGYGPLDALDAKP